MLPRALLLWMTWCVALWSPAAVAQPYPSRPVTLVVPYAAGSGVDILARILTAKLGERLGQPIIVEAKPGAGSAIGTDFVAKSVPNGYTLMLTTNVLPVLPALYRNLSFNPVSDFTHIAKVATGSMALVVNPTVLPIKSLDELVARARAEPGKLNYGSAGNGTPHHLGMELLKQKLAPSFDELGLKNLDIDVYYLISGPAKLPPEITAMLNSEIAKTLNDVREPLLALGLVAEHSAPDALAALINVDVARWKELITSARITVE